VIPLLLAALQAAPGGFGTLRQDDIALHIVTPNAELRILPLEEEIIRLFAPDSYQSLRLLVGAHSAEIEQVSVRRAIPRPTVFLVTFFGREPRAEFSPDDVTITSQNRFFRPAAIIPLSPAWTAQRLSQRETASALYLFEEGIALDEPFVVSYGAAQNDQWGERLPRIERERSRVDARAESGPSP
jgi:hypothetical protein